MPWWARLLIHYGAPLVAEAVGALIRGLEASGNRPDAALSFAIDVVSGLEDSVVPNDERRERAADAIALHLQQESGTVPSRRRCHTLVQLALEKVRDAPG